LSGRVGVEAHRGSGGGEGPHEALEDVRHVGVCVLGDSEEDADDEDDGSEDGE